MCTECNECGYRDSEVKPGGGISKHAVKITLRVTSVDDMKRDVMKSDTAACFIPEMELELSNGTLGGKYTTIEGLLGDIKAQLEKNNQFLVGDSSEEDSKGKFAVWLQDFDALISQHQSGSISRPFTVILDDPLANSYIHTPHGTPSADPNLTLEIYTRSHEQNEELGLNDINTEDYFTEEQKKLNEQLDAEEGKKTAAPAAAEADLKRAQEREEEEKKERLQAEMKGWKIGGLINPLEHDFDAVPLSASAPPAANAPAAATAHATTESEGTSAPATTNGS
jgi:zinc finger protein